MRVTGKPVAAVTNAQHVSAIISALGRVCRDDGDEQMYEYLEEIARDVIILKARKKGRG